jgi:hypothetical protein
MPLGGSEIGMADLGAPAPVVSLTSYSIDPVVIQGKRATHLRYRVQR